MLIYVIQLIIKRGCGVYLYIGKTWQMVDIVSQNTQTYDESIDFDHNRFFELNVKPFISLKADLTHYQFPGKQPVRARTYDIQMFSPAL